MVTHSRTPAWWIPMDRGAWWVTVHRVAKNQLKWLSRHAHTAHASQCQDIIASPISNHFSLPMILPQTLLRKETVHNILNFLPLYLQIFSPTPCSLQDVSSLNLGPWQWEHGVLTTGPPGNSQNFFGVLLTLTSFPAASEVSFILFKMFTLVIISFPLTPELCILGISSLLYFQMGFPGSSAGKESAWNVGDPCLIPGLGRSPGEGIGYPLWYFQGLSLLAPLNMNKHIQDAPSVKLKTSLDPWPFVYL